MSESDSPTIRGFFDEATNTVTYLVADPATKVAAVIDPLLDFNHRNGRVKMESADKVLAAAAANGLKIEWILETHAHADHLSGAPYFKLRTGAKIGIGEHIRQVQRVFMPLFNATDISGEGSEFDHLFVDGETFPLGNLTVEVIHTPGHTAACIAYKINDAIFVGDTLFMPDYGTARADFPGGSAHNLYRSIQKILSYPPETRLFVCHDYMPESRSEFRWETTVAEERKNIQIAGKTEDEFVAMREARDATLAAPLMLMPSIQANIRAGKFPPAEANGVSYFKIPVRLPERVRAEGKTKQQ
jgi:glyoxylase-like metal-dependent hydrolase (beta-lactamase superfamily II)